MPIFEFSCPKCEHLSELFLRASEAETAQTCPDCGGLLQKLMSASGFAIGKAHLMREKAVSANGFTQYRKAGDGYYEKTAGKGPDTIRGDQKP
jgi:putative FmdB family regulatory protein